MTPQKALERLQLRCSRVELCCGQVRKKLQEWSVKNVKEGKEPFPDSVIDSIIEQLVKERYVDDSRFAEAYVRDKARFSKWGKVKISYNLRVLGVPDDIVRSALENNSACFAAEFLEDLLRKRWDMLPESDSLERKRSKILRFALGRGFGYDQIIPIIKMLG